MTKKNFTRRITSMVCAAVLSAGLAISSLPAGALAVHAEENTQVQEVTAETGTAGTDNAGVESAEPQPSAAPEASAEETAPVEAEPAAETAPADQEVAAEPAAETAPSDQEVAAEPVTDTAPVVAEEASVTPAADTAPATETETTAEVETATEAEQQAAVSLPAPDETPADDVVASAPVATEAPEIEVSADKAAGAALSEAAPEETVESEALAENTEAAAEAQTPGEPTALTELATKAEAVAAKEQAGETQETAAVDEAATSEDSASEKAAEESVSENNTADMEDSTPAAEAGSTDTEEMASEEDAAENSSDAEEEVSPALALRMLAVSADAAAGALGENVDSSSQGSGETVKIRFDEIVHSVKINGQDMVVFCMNSDLHWPHDTPTFQAPANYKPVDTGLTDEQENQLTTLLYAGYPYNGFSLFQIVDQSEPLSEDDFDKLLVPPAWIRSDFPDLGETQFTYKNVAPNKENANKLDDFLANAYTYYKNGVTASGHTHDDIIATTFWRAASVIKNYGYNNALNAYKHVFGNSKDMVTKDQAYNNTRDAVWYLMKEFGVPKNNNSHVPGSDTLAEQLYNTAIAGNANVLKAAPTSDQINVTGDNKFVYDATTKLWKTGTLTLAAPVMHDFALSLPAGITTETGSTVIRTGESFVLMTNVKPADNSTALISADLSWIDGGLKRYTPANNEKAPDGKGFQDMIGVLIKSTTVASSFSLTYEEPKKPDEKPSDKPEDNTEGKPDDKPEEKPEQKPEDNSGSNNEDTNKSDASEDAKDPSTPETPPAEDTDPGTPDNTTDNKNTEPTDPVTNNMTESSDPVETNTTPGTDPVVTNNTHSSDPVVTRTTVAPTPTATNTTAAEPAVINAAAVSAPVVTDYTTATAPQIVSTPVSNGETIVTGDESQMGLYLALFAAAAAGLAVWFAGKHKKNFR